MRGITITALNVHIVRNVRALTTAMMVSVTIAAIANHASNIQKSWKKGYAPQINIVKSSLIIEGIL
jgi:hypothetical protein